MRLGKSVRYNRISKEKAYEICNRKLKSKPIDIPTCYECYYHSGRCELGRTESPFCDEFRTDWIYSNDVHHQILHDYDWCLEHFDEFCELDKECFVAIYGKKEEGISYISNENGDDGNE